MVEGRVVKGGGWGCNFRGSFSFILVAKLKALKCDLKSLNKEVFGNAFIKKMVFNDMGFLGIKADGGGPFP